MAEHVEVVIKIPKYYLTHPQDYSCLAECVRRGILLQKGHGDLKDMSNLKYVFDLTREDPIYSGKDIKQAVNSMKSIIEADKEVDE